MSTISNLMEPRTEVSVGASFRRAGNMLRNWWIAYVNWRLEQMAINRLRSMSDRELKDIGVYRSAIDFAVKGGAESHFVFKRYY